VLSLVLPATVTTFEHVAMETDRRTNSAHVVPNTCPKTDPVIGLYAVQ